MSLLRYVWVTLAGFVGAACLLRAAEHFIFGGAPSTIAVQVLLGVGFLSWSVQGVRRLRGTSEARGAGGDSRH
jgi:hypothetical protein